MQIKVAIAEDHHLIRKGITLILESIPDFVVIFDALNGQDLIEKIENASEKPDVVLMDVNMPIMNGEQATRYLSSKYINLKIIALSVNNDNETIRAMIKVGAHAYLFKDSAPELFSEVIRKVYSDGFYYDKHVIESLVPERNNPSLIKDNDNPYLMEMELLKQLTARELTFLNYCCTELTYKEIASEMDLTFRTIDSHRDNLFTKLSVRSRIGLVIFAIKTGIFKI